MLKTPPSEVRKLRTKLAGSFNERVLREQANLQFLTHASREASAVANPATRPMEYVNALYQALTRTHLGQTA